MKRLLSLLFVIGLSLPVLGQYQVGDKATDFKLKNIDGKMVSLKNYKEAKGFIVVFTCNHCPYSQAYEQRIIDLDKKYAPLGYPVIAINPNDPKVQPEDSFEKMKERAAKYQYTFPYLVDESQNITRTYGATRTPHVFVLEKEGTAMVVRYIGAIDDNTEKPEAVETPYVARAIDALMTDSEIVIATTKAIGCTIKWRKL